MEEGMNTSLLIKKGRGRWDILGDILKATQEDRKIKKTRIMQKACLDWKTFYKYFDYLLQEGFLEESNNDECFVLTQKGRELLNRIQEVEKVMDQA
jgi:predicted transcriptional regulator